MAGNLGLKKLPSKCARTTLDTSTGVWSQFSENSRKNMRFERFSSMWWRELHHFVLLRRSGQPCFPQELGSAGDDASDTQTFGDEKYFWKKNISKKRQTYSCVTKSLISVWRSSDKIRENILVYGLSVSSIWRVMYIMLYDWEAQGSHFPRKYGCMLT